VKVGYVPAPEALAVLAQFAPQIKKALRCGQGDAVTPEEVLASIVDERAQVWAAHEDGEAHAVVVLSVPQYRVGRKVFVEFLAGGKMNEWADEMESALLECGERVGAMCVEASCRPGLARYLKRRGWKQKAIIMEAPR